MELSLTKEQLESLRNIVDVHGIGEVINTLATFCADKIKLEMREGPELSKEEAKLNKTLHKAFNDLLDYYNKFKERYPDL